MIEIILNEECAHCNDKECHDGEHFCNQAMKENSFYKNAKLYKGLEVIQRPTYEELEQQNVELIGEIAFTENKSNNLEKENAELKEQNRNYEQLIDAGSVTLMKDRLKNYKQLTKAKEIIKSFSEFVNNKVEYDPEHPQEYTDLWNKLCEEAEQFLKELEK